MEWHPVNSLTFESATHRVRRAGYSMWLAERKSADQERAVKIGSVYANQSSAIAACEADAYRMASSGR
jgi:hypothetical protein